MKTKRQHALAYLVFPGTLAAMAWSGDPATVFGLVLLVAGVACAWFTWTATRAGADLDDQVATDALYCDECGVMVATREQLIEVIHVQRGRVTCVYCAQRRARLRRVV